MMEAKVPAPMFPVDIEGAPKIVLAGREWPIPKLAHAQNKKVVPAIARIMPTLMRGMAAQKDGDSAMVMAIIAGLDEATYDAMATATFWALKRAHPGLGQGEFDEMPIEARELFNGMSLIVAQSGFFKQADASTGEARAAAQQSTPLPQSTGTASSPASAAPQDGPGNTSNTPSP